MPQKDATVQLQDAAAIVDQWHAAYMEVMTPQQAHPSLCQLEVVAPPIRPPAAC